jgi:steroid delta-isomerase-like uncharacterized protein
MNENKKVIQSYLDTVNSDNPSDVSNFLTEDVKWSSPAGQKTGLEQTRKYMETWFTAFPDLKLEPVNSFSEGNQAVLECKLRGTHRGNFVSDLGQFAPTNRKIDVDLVNFFKIRNGKIAEIRVIYDTAVMMDQLGVEMEKRAA